MVDSGLELDLPLMLMSGDVQRVTPRPAARPRVHQVHQGLASRRRCLGVIQGVQTSRWQRLEVNPRMWPRLLDAHQGLASRRRRPVGGVTELPTDDVTKGAAELDVDEGVEDVVGRETDSLHRVRQLDDQLQQLVVHRFTADVAATAQRRSFDDVKFKLMSYST